MDDILVTEGICMFYDNMEEIGVITSDNSDFLAIHTDLEWKDIKDKIENLRLREMVGEIKFVKTTAMKNGFNNHIFVVGR